MAPDNKVGRFPFDSVLINRVNTTAIIAIYLAIHF